MAHPLIFQQQAHIDSLHLLQYNTAYFNPYEVKHRKRTSRAQLTVLEATFQENNKPSSAVKKSLAARLDMPIRNVQVWFQNRRAKDKNLALKARLKAGQGSDAAAAGGDSSKEESDAEGDDIKAPKTPTSASDLPSSLLIPPSNVTFRRGSAPSLGVVSYPPPISPSTGTRIVSPHTNRSASDSIRTSASGTCMPSLAVPAAGMLGRRKSLPAFHPALQKQMNAAAHPLSTVSDTLQSSNSGTQQGSGLSADQSSGSGHGGVYRSMSSGRLALTPYPVSTRASQNYNYRPGSTPGTGVFRIPANPNPPLPSGWGLQGTAANTADSSAVAGSSGPTQNRPYAFPPRPYADIPKTGPLPTKGFRFGDSSNSVPSFKESPPAGASGTDEEDDPLRARGLGQTHRFSSLASDFSVESDATGTTATTATSSTGFSPFTNPALSVTNTHQIPMAAYRARFSLTGSGLTHPFGHANTDMPLGSSISYGLDSNAVAPAGLAGPGHMLYPQKFDPTSRRASCPAHFIEDMELLNVDQLSNSRMQNTDSLNNLALSASIGNPRSNSIRKSSSGIGLARSPLSMRVQVPENAAYPEQASYEEAAEEKEVDSEPMTAVAGAYSGIFPSNYAIGSASVSSTISGDKSRQTTDSPQTRFNGFPHTSSISSTSSFEEGPYSASGSQNSPLDATSSSHLGSTPMFMANFTQEPAYETSASFVYGNVSHANSETQLPFPDHHQFDAPARNAYSAQQLYTTDPTDYSAYGSFNGALYQPSGVKQEQGHFTDSLDSQPQLVNSFTSFLHAPAPLLPSSSSSSSLAGAMHDSGLDANHSFQW